MKNSFRDKLNDKSSIYKKATMDLSNHKDNLKSLQKELLDHKKIRETFQQAAIYTQTYLEKHLSIIVTNALQSVFYEKDLQFVVQFDKKGTSTACKLSIIEDEEEYDIIDDKGFGIADIASFALRVAYVLLDSVDNVLILDEPFRNVDKDRIPHASKMVHELSHKLNIQLIIVTHIEDLTEYADTVLTTIKTKKYTEVEKRESI